MRSNQKLLELFIGISFTPCASNTIWKPDDFTRLISKAASYNSYAETAKSIKTPDSDTLHRRIQSRPMTAYHSNFLALTERCLQKIGNRRVILIIDYTHEPFYGYSQSMWIHGYKPEKGSKGSYKFLVASILAEGRRYFVDCIPMDLFTDTVKAVEKILDKTRLNIEAVLLDRGFASEAIIKLLKARRLRYLMLYPERTNVHKILKSMKGDYLRIDFKVKDTDTRLVITKDRYDWIFVTNMEFYHFCKYVRVYKLRWNIETGFRVQDEARIKSKSIGIIVRYFLFLVSILLYNGMEVPE